MSDAAHTPGPYYAEHGMVWKDSIETANEDGSISVTMGFPVCTMHEIVGEDAADTVAELMNAGDAALSKALPPSNPVEGDE